GSRGACRQTPSVSSPRSAGQSTSTCCPHGSASAATRDPGALARVPGAARSPRGGFSMKTLVLFLSVGLTLGLALSPTWGQPHPQAAIGTQGHERRGQRRAVASDIPVDDLDGGTPRRTVEGFLQAARAHNYRRAAEYLDLRGLPAEEAKSLGPQLARHLKIVLDQQLPID